MSALESGNVDENLSSLVTVSTVVPVYRGEEYLPTLVANLESVQRNWEAGSAPIQLTEAIFVDDGSEDNSYSVLCQLSESRPWMRVIRLSRNFGQHSAIVAGICHTTGDWVVTLDEDLQHDPAYVDKMLQKATDQSWDIVYARPNRESHGGSWRDRSSKWVKTVLGKITGIPIMPLFNSFRLIRGGIARAAASSCSSHTYLDIAFLWFSKSITSVSVDMRDKRFLLEGKSGYSLITLIQHARKLIVSSNVDFALWGILLGLSAVFFSIFLVAWIFIGVFVLPDTVQVPGWASVLASISLLSGVIIGLLTMILEYVSIMVVNQLGKPVFFTVDRSTDEKLKRWYSSKDVSNNNSP